MTTRAQRDDGERALADRVNARGDRPAAFVNTEGAAGKQNVQAAYYDDVPSAALLSLHRRLRREEADSTAAAHRAQLRHLALHIAELDRAPSQRPRSCTGGAGRGAASPRGLASGCVAAPAPPPAGSAESLSRLRALRRGASALAAAPLLPLPSPPPSAPRRAPLATGRLPRPGTVQLLRQRPRSACACLSGGDGGGGAPPPRSAAAPGAASSGGAEWLSLKQRRWPEPSPPVRPVELPASRFNAAGGPPLLPSVRAARAHTQLLSDILERRLFKRADIDALLRAAVAAAPLRDRAAVRDAAAALRASLGVPERP
ncbi:hypothetical protein Rsub_02522 [Raphidocelis subcapitata]|uniref:Uncharacterized protein n=1 Tax=Raphidocelis subcapitata TaxID=307507 RepID=A0A2V0NQ90_9CHLO|nr:hypothetical protein Rsub_02522 [Raphidocelis subcapitata]|eukprot:GBF89818.1 hypothetical protein Rsub_02522 [Raphidocelis subcapitata]